MPHTLVEGIQMSHLNIAATTSHDFWYPHTFAGVIDISLDFGDRGWNNAVFHTDESIGLNVTGNGSGPGDADYEDYFDDPDEEDDAVELHNQLAGRLTFSRGFFNKSTLYIRPLPALFF